MKNMPLSYIGSKTVSLNGASQGLIDMGADQFVYAKVQAALLTSTTGFVIATPTSGGLADVFSTASKTRLSGAAGITGTTLNSAFANQPSGDTVTVVSDTVGDSATITLYATSSGSPIRVYHAQIDGTTPVVISSELATGYFQVILGIELDQACAGTITLKKTSGGATIKTIGPGVLSKGVTNVNFSGNGLPIYITTASGTKTLGVFGIPINEDDSVVGEAMTSAGATGVYCVRTFGLIQKLLWGDLANTVVAYFGQYGISAASNSGILIAHKADHDISCWGRRYLAWAVVDANGALANGSTNDYIRLELYG